MGLVVNVVPDNRGGMWVASGPPLAGANNWFYRLTDKVNEPVFSEVAHPIREPITATAAGGDGSFWVATESGTVYRHDRATGWDRVALKGWDAGGVVQSPAYGLAVGQDGEGLLVGQRGRIAQIGPRAVALDPGAVMCSSDRSTCATTQTLRSAAVASDGSALAGGDQRAVIWRPPGGNGRFIAVNSPDVTKSAKITAISMPHPAQAWLATDTGDVIKGTLTGTEWTWVRESTALDGTPLARDRYGSPLAVRSVAVDDRGHGFAVGDRGLILERGGGGAHPWHRIPGFDDHLHSVALGPNGRGAIIGGSAGLVLTWSRGRFEVARHGDWFDPLSATSFGSNDTGIVGVALLPGYKPGEVEAWAATQPPPFTTDAGRNPSPAGILHYASDPNEPLLGAGSGRVQPMHTDTVPHRAGEIDLAAFGKSDCRLTTACPELTGSKLSNELVLRGIRDALTTGPNRPDLAISTGDVSDIGGSRDPNLVSGPTSASIMHERWSDLVAERFARAKVPLYGALGGTDLSKTEHCDALSHGICAGTASTGQKVGTNLAWRQAFAEAPAPWGTGKDLPTSHSGLTFDRVTSITDAGESTVSTAGTPLGGARTHYAVDVSRDGKRLLRLVVVDTSMKTAAGAVLQNPVRDQLTWLDDVLSSRGAGVMAVVVSETPSYAYSNTAGAATDTLADSAAFETVLVKNNVTAVVSGRLGWNGLYWLAAPGLHTPCPGGSYQQRPPTDASQLCQPSGNDPVSAADGVATTLNQTSPQKVPLPSKVFQDVAGLSNIPVAIAASAGGKFGPDGRATGSGSQGFWRGYTRIRLLPPDETGRRPVPEIEQYPIFDWIGIQAREHTLAPGRTLTLNGYGREPLGIENTPNYIDINGPAITHSYDLVLADPQRPYMPLVDQTNSNPNHYVFVPSDVGASVDHQTGEVTYSGRGNHPPIYALAILSVGDKATSWPIVLAPRRSFAPPTAARGPRIVIPPPPTIFSALPTPLPSPPSTPIQTPPNLNLPFPSVPPLPTLSLNSPQTTPPPPPPPPPPPVSPAASALQISPNPVGLNVAPAATVIPPPAPPIQPAPPGGARREARQRQAAAAKSEEGGDQGAGQEASGNGDGGKSASTRLDRPRDLAFTAHAERHQASAWSRDLLYGGGLGMAALTLALGWSLMRPGPRRRRPELPAPAFSRAPRRRY
jgi:hypothetical protein